MKSKRKINLSGNLKKTIIAVIVTILFALLYFYLELPALNLRAREFYSFLIVLSVVYAASYYALCVIDGITFSVGQGNLLARQLWRTAKIPILVIAVAAVVSVAGAISGLTIFHAGAYSRLISVETGDFTKDVSEISMSQIPMLDSYSANALADRKLGELSDLVSQFNVSEDSAQINFKNVPVRVNYLNYDTFFKWWNNRREGLPAYMIVNMVSQEVEVVRLSEGMKISPSEYFGRDLNRKLRFQYPTFIFGNVNFEIDEEGTPYWIASVIRKRIGIFSGDDVKGAVLLNAVTGRSEYYDAANVPQWVDRVYSADLLVEQYNYYGLLHNGFINTLFSQTDCTTTTSGYNYIALNDDVYLYSGITSISGDRGNIGFILVNQRTKEAKYYSCAGATEESAMSSAEGAVQQYRYSSTFPLLLNIGSQPTYFMALKDAAGLVKMYAMVNVQQYQIVSTGSSFVQCANTYQQLLADNGILSKDYVAYEEEESDQNDGGASYESDTGIQGGSAQGHDYSETVSGTIAEIRSADIRGTTYYYIYLKDDDGSHVYRLDVSEDETAVLLDVGDRITLRYAPGDGRILPAIAE